MSGPYGRPAGFFRTPRTPLGIYGPDPQYWVMCTWPWSETFWLVSPVWAAVWRVTLWLVSLLCGLQIVHRDLAARNLLVKQSSRPNRKFLTKIGDFGLARKVGSDGIHHSDIGVNFDLIEFVTAIEAIVEVCLISCSCGGGRCGMKRSDTRN